MTQVRVRNVLSAVIWLGKMYQVRRAEFSNNAVTVYY